MPTNSLTPRQRFARIIAHQEADRVPLDLAGTSLTNIDPGVARGLRKLLGFQADPLLSPRAFRKLVKPYLAERIAFTHQFTRAHYWHHSCGSVHALIPDLLECGVEILNPIQPGSCKMEPERLKADFGSRLCFHGGFDTQNVLPFCTPAEIEAEVARVMEAMKPGGGYIFSAGHNIQDDVPPKNALVMFQAAGKIGAYSG